MTAKELKKQLRKLKKKWPQNLRPVFLPNGDIRIIRSMDAETLRSMGIKTVQDLRDQQKIFENNIVTSQEHNVVQEFIELVGTNARSELSPIIAFPMFEEFFPGILDDITQHIFERSL